MLCRVCYSGNQRQPFIIQVLNISKQTQAHFFSQHLSPSLPPFLPKMNKGASDQVVIGSWWGC